MISQSKAAPTALQRLAARSGIADHYRSVDGLEVPTDDGTRRRLLAAMGIAAADERESLESLEELERRQEDELVPPVQVLAAERSARLQGRLPAEERLRAVVELESGETLAVELRGGAPGGRPEGIPLGQRLPVGYHELTIEHGGGAPARGRLIVAPARSWSVADALGAPRGAGVVANLYTLHDARSQGIGDLTDLATLASWAAARGASFVGVNPLHATPNHGQDVSPYRPSSRIFGNPAYIDVEAVPGIRACAAAAALLDAPLRESLRAPGRHVRYEEAWRWKLSVLRAYHAATAGLGAPSADEEPSQAAALETHARYMAIAEWTGLHSWRAWPEELRSPDGAAVDAFAREHPREVALHAWLQRELARQLRAAAAEAVRSGLRLGIYQDLAVGSSPDGSDRWAFPGIFVDGASIGAPPDAFTAEGQVWGLPPVDPAALRQDGYRYFVLMVRAAMASAGMVRIDHVMGLARQFWVPRGATGREGAYVTYPVEDLAGILALESRRHGTVVVGEDLGTVPEDFTELLDRWGILSTRVAYFEMDPGPVMRPASAYRCPAIVSANTHDLAPLRGWLSGDDLRLRRRVGAFPDDDTLDAALGARHGEVDAMILRLRREGHLSRGDLSYAGVLSALTRYLASTPSQLVAVSLDDVAGEREPVNLPGVSLDRHPSWSRRMARPLAEILGSSDAEAVMAALRAVSGPEATAPGRSTPASDASPPAPTPGSPRPPTPPSPATP